MPWARLKEGDILRQSTWYIHQEDTESLEKAEFSVTIVNHKAPAVLRRVKRSNEPSQLQKSERIV